MTDTVKTEMEKLAVLTLEHLQAIRGDITEIKGRMNDLHEGQILIKRQLYTMSGEDLRNEASIASLQIAIDRINNRLNITEN